MHCLHRDVTAQMASDGVEDIRDFRWESQMRYYWEHNAAPPSGVPAQVSFYNSTYLWRPVHIQAASVINCLFYTIYCRADALLCVSYCT